MRVHLVGLPHTQTTRAWDHCAYTARVRKLPSILAPHGYETVVYSGTDNEAVCKEHVTVATMGDQERRWFGAGGWNPEAVFDRWNPNDPCWVEMNATASEQICERWEPGDAIALSAGRCQQLLVDMVAARIGRPLVIEPMCGYEGVLEDSQRCFESQSHRAYVYGLRHDGDGRPFDTVIPNSFDPAEYHQEPSDGYLLYLGRMTERKGMTVVAELARRFDVITAGQGTGLDGVPHCGIVLGEDKAELLAGARALLTPSVYVEPFGGVAVEAQLSGVPVISTDYGAFTETIEHGVTGFRCNTLQQFIDAAHLADELDRDLIAEKARARFSLAAVGPAYDEWLQRCSLLYGAGWPQLREMTDAVY